MDSSESPTHGDREGSAYNGHFGCICYHPLFCFNQFGNLERCFPRPGNVHSAEDWRLVFEPVVARYRERQLRRYFRADAAFAKPEIYEFLEAEGYAYAIRLPTNAVLQEKTSHLLTRPVGRLPNHVRVFHASFSYKAPQGVEHWSLTTLQTKLTKIGAKVVHHGRYVTVQLAEVAIARSLFTEILGQIRVLRPVPLPP